MTNPCPACKVCPLHSGHCEAPDDLCMYLLKGVTGFAKDHKWTQERLDKLEQTNILLRDRFVKTLAEKSVTPQHELLLQMLEDTGHYGLADMTAYEVYDWMKKVKV